MNNDLIYLFYKKLEFIQFTQYIYMYIYVYVIHILYICICI